MEEQGEATGLLAASEPSNNNNVATYGGGQDGGTSVGVHGQNGENGMKPKDKNRRLQRHPSLDKVDEDPVGEESEKPKSCPSFGVKSYLHHFYDTSFYRDPEVYEDDDDLQYLLRPQRRRRCAAVWWKVFVWIGANFLVFGIVGVLVGYLVPQRSVVITSSPNHEEELVDPGASYFNFNLSVCKLVGLVLFCIGGLTLTIALLFPSFLYNYCEDDWPREKPFAVRVGKAPVAKSPVEMSVPYSSEVSEVQPDRKTEESIITREGMLPFKE